MREHDYRSTNEQWANVYVCNNCGLAKVDMGADGINYNLSSKIDYQDFLVAFDNCESFDVELTCNEVIIKGVIE